MILRMIEATWAATVDAAPYIVGGAILAGLMRAFLDAARLRSMLAERSWRSVFRAAILGVPLPLCSCSVLPVAMQLRRAGASKGATGAFLVSTPESGVDSFVVSIGVLNPFMAVARVIGALMTGLVAGLLQNHLERNDPIAPPPAPEPARVDEPLSKRLLAGQRYAFSDLLPEMAHFYLAGLLATGLVVALLPEAFLSTYLGGGLPGMLIVSVVGVAIYICAASSTPLVAALILKGMSPGTALVLLLAGPASSLASLGAVREMLGQRGLVAYLLSIIGCAIALGLGVDAINTGMGLGLSRVGSGIIADAEAHGNILSQVCGGMLLIYFAYHTAKRYMPKGNSHTGHDHAGHDHGDSPAAATMPATGDGCGCCKSKLPRENPVPLGSAAE
jgi:uncharacterized membrane protein YraQ (UPF0718 family)